MNQLVKTPLWEHQRDTLEYFAEQEQVLCAWDMGTGKTLFAIERDARIRETVRVGRNKDSGRKFRTLVVAPLSTHKQWKNAFESELPGIKVKQINPKDRTAFLMGDYDVWVMHYEAVRIMWVELKAHMFDHGIFDECHRLKNRKTQQTQAVKKLKIPLLTDMSGSPVTDRPQDIWSILHHLKPKEYTSYWTFFHNMTNSERPWINTKGGKRMQAQYWVTHGPSERWLTNGLDDIEEYYSRILIDQCIDLPELVHTTINVDLTPKMRKAYAEMHDEMITWVREMGEDEEDHPLAAPAIISRMTRLQQLAMATIEYNPTTEKYRMVAPSPKLDAVVERIRDNDGDKFLVFSQWKHPLLLLRSMLEKQKGLPAPINPCMFTGDETGPLRENSKKRFIEGDSRVMLATIDAGGEGVDGLQHVCNNVIFLDRSWTPTKNDQAIARLRRGGQTKPVNVIDVVSTGTVDIIRNQKIELKKQWVMQTLGDI